MKFDLFSPSFKEVTDEKKFFGMQNLCQYPHSCISVSRDGVNKSFFVCVWKVHEEEEYLLQ